MTPIAPLITGFLREHLPIEKGFSPHTCETYAYAFRLLFLFASKRVGKSPSQLCLEDLDAALILDFLEWLAPGPRPYAEVMDAWRTSCPRLTIWEDAMDQKLIERRRETGTQLVALTAVGGRLLVTRGR